MVERTSTSFLSTHRSTMVFYRRLKSAVPLAIFIFINCFGRPTLLLWTVPVKPVVCDDSSSTRGKLGLSTCLCTGSRQETSEAPWGVEAHHMASCSVQAFRRRFQIADIPRLALIKCIQLDPPLHRPVPHVYLEAQPAPPYGLDNADMLYQDVCSLESLEHDHQVFWLVTAKRGCECNFI